MRFFILLLLVPIFLEGRVKLHPLFSDHCVLQIGQETPVWGSAEIGEEVAVHFRGEVFKTKADDSGSWMVRIDTKSPGGPFEMIVKGALNEVRVIDILVGEVWLASGQSNMEWKLADGNSHSPMINAEAEAAKANYPLMRQFEVPRKLGLQPEKDVVGQWIVCSPETAHQFSAVAFFFGRDILASQQVPVGILNSSFGGTPVQAWSSEEVTQKYQRYQAELETIHASTNDPIKAQEIYENRVNEWFKQFDPNPHSEERYSRNYDDTNWLPVSIGSPWDKIGLGDFDGVAWYRLDFELPKNWAGKEAVLELGRIDDFDTVWINEQRIGQTAGWYEERKYKLPADLLRTGSNTIAIRILDRGFRGGFVDGETVKPTLRIVSDADQSFVLSEKWKIDPSASFKGTDPFPMAVHQNQHTPSVLFNGMISPLIPYGIRGVIWYQGESNSDDPKHYQEIFPEMVADWRARWGIGDFPFLYVQIAPFKDQPPEIREAQRLSQKEIENSAMVVTIDVGDAEDIHPINKEPVGERLALAARGLAYGEKIVYSGPVVNAMRIEGDEAILRFESIGSGLVAGGKQDLRGFEIAGDDSNFFPANAIISGNEVRLSSEFVATPVAVRYAWANVADGNLYNKAGLPASPFKFGE